MLTLVTGGAASGKSEYAERLAAACDGPRVYIATMRPLDKESVARIEKHRAARADRRFSTIERYHDLKGLRLPCGTNAVLLECMSNLAANELFGGPVELTEENAAALTEKTADKITADLFRLRENCGHLVLVTNDIFADRDGETTLVQAYKQVLGTVNCRMAAAADTVIEVTAGIADVWKGAERRSADYECVE